MDSKEQRREEFTVFDELGTVPLSAMATLVRGYMADKVFTSDTRTLTK
jgi:hypothetical protein